MNREILQKIYDLLVLASVVIIYASAGIKITNYFSGEAAILIDWVWWQSIFSAGVVILLAVSLAILIIDFKNKQIPSPGIF